MASAMRQAGFLHPPQRRGRYNGGRSRIWTEFFLRQQHWQVLDKRLAYCRIGKLSYGNSSIRS